AQAILRRHAARASAAERAGERLFGRAARPIRAGETAYVPGCTALRLTPGEAVAGHHLVSAALPQTPSPVVIGPCCGLPLLEAGDSEGFRRAAQRLLVGLAGAREAVFLDPGCLHALRVLAPPLAVGLGTPPLRHWVELGATLAARLGTRHGKDPTVYHDACRPGRGLGLCADAVRLLEHVTSRPP